MRISDWSSDVYSSDLLKHLVIGPLLRLLFVTKNLSQFRHFLGPFKRCAAPCRRHALSMIPFHPCRIPCHNGLQCAGRLPPETIGIEPGFRSEEHTSELQSLMRISSAVICLQKKNPNKT